jgi:hypothetical protein
MGYYLNYIVFKCLLLIFSNWWHFLIMKLKRNTYYFGEIIYFKLQYFGNASCHYQAKIISKEETDNIIIRYIK